jgi:hypothetical protein
MSMMIVVPTLSRREQCNPPDVNGIVIGVVISVPESGDVTNEVECEWDLQYQQTS